MALNKIDKLGSQISAGNKTPIYKSLQSVDRNVEVIANITTLDQIIAKPKASDTFYTSKLLNYVEPVIYSGIQKTAFYTELSTNFQPGDRVFMLNGYYDSDDYIQKDKYTKFTDGYRVLDVNGCRVVLNIDYTGQLPYTDYNQEDLIFVHNITSQERFNYINTLSIGLSYSTNFNTEVGKTVYSSFSGNFLSKTVNLYGGNIIFVPENLKLKSNTDDISETFAISASGFYMKSIGSRGWSNITTLFQNNRLKVMNPIINPKGLIGNKKIVIIGEDFVWSGNTFRERSVYKYSTTKRAWVFDKLYKQPVISKINFRGGLFKGKHQDGIFGSYDKVLDWNEATWNSGFFVNSNWISGQMNSKSLKGAQNYIAKLSVDTNGKSIALQNVDTSNNKGFGYNYVIDSTIKKSTIKNGNFENSNIGISYSTTSIENYYNNTATQSVSITGGNFNFCDIHSSTIDKSTINDSIINNTLIKKSRSINNQLIDSVAFDVDYNSEGGLKIIGADLYSYYKTENQETTDDYTDIRGVLKLFISDADFLKMEKGDSFYIEKVNKDYFVSTLTIDQKIILPIETRYLLDYYLDSEKNQDKKISVSIKSRNENRYKFYTKLKATPTYETLYSPTFEDPIYWVNPTPDGDSPYNTPIVEWSYGRQSYFQYDVVLFTANGQTKLYYYLGDDLTGPGASTGLLTDPTDATKSGPLNGLWWEEVGIYQGEWDKRQDINPNPNDVYKYFDPSSAEFVYIKRTSDPGNEYRTSIDSAIPGVFSESRGMAVVDSGFNACSIDLDSTLFGFYEDSIGNRYYTGSGFDGISIDKINEAFLNTYIKPSDFRSGLFTNSKWISGFNVNYYQNIIRKKTETTLDISYYSPNSLKVRIKNIPFDLKFQKIGYDIKKNDYVWLNGVVYQNGTTTIPLSGMYNVSKDPFFIQVNNEDYIEYTIVSSFLKFDNLDFLGIFTVLGAEDANYITLSKFSIEKSTIVSGLFRRTHLSDTILSNPQFDNEDANFTPQNSDILRLVNIVSSGNKITIEDGVNFNSHIVDANFSNGLVHESVWNGATFSLGIFSSGFWKSGTFLNGKFINSRSLTPENVYYSDSQLYKNWLSGKFSIGEFYNSVWLDGIFNNGLFWNSDFYGGIWNNGVLGSSKIPMRNTTFGHYEKLQNIGATCALWYNGTVDNALMGGDGVVYWYNGRYNSGEFTSYGSVPTKESIWFNGEFNGSKLTNLARWKNGTFNNGKFWSYYGWDKVGPTNSSTNPSDFGWESGQFKNGEFGFKGMTANSVWYGGQFLNGVFQGRFWNNGYFIGGNFYGSGVMSSTPSSVSSVGEFDFANSFSQEYYGLWNNGYVIDNITEVSSDELIKPNLKRALEPKSNLLNQKTILSNVLWLDGEFNHKFGSLKDSLFLKGKFYNGDFDGGIFNPYIDQDFLGSFSNSSFGGNAVWYSGDFLTGSFWSSQWVKGRFYSGYMSGAKWNNGTWYYGTAENITWMDGTWKNGNWNGSPYDYNLISPTESVIDIGTESSVFATVSRYIMNDGREKDIIFKTYEYNGENENVHILNVFSASNPINFTVDGFTNSRSWTYSVAPGGGLVDGTYQGMGDIIIGYNGKRPIKKLGLTTFTASKWSIFPSFELVRDTVPAIYQNSDESISQTVKPKFNSQTGKSTLTVTDGNLATYGGDFRQGNAVIYGYNIFSSGSFNSAPSARLYAFKGGTTSIFTAASRSYTIKFTVAVELLAKVSLDLYIGGLSSSTYTLDSDAYKYSEITRGSVRQYEDYYPKVYTITTVYNTDTDSISTLEGKELWIKKTSQGVLRLLKCEITYKQIEYNLQFNNLLYPGITPDTRTVDFPTYSVVLSAASGAGKEVGLNFGNGIFKRGIWENGVWNNGYRSGSEIYGWNQDIVNSDDIVKAINISTKETYKIGSKTWRVTLDILSENLSILSVSKKVAIGNIVGIDANNYRIFFRDPIDIISVDTRLKKLVVKIVTNYDLREIIKDSPNHIIYITQNIWLNGVFLNGYFRGVWNNGVFKGFPRLTEMNETQWIDGTLDGGHFISEQNYDDENRVFYNTGLIQNMTFYANNVGVINSFATTSRFFSYQSWIDVVTDTSTVVNINLDSKVYSKTTLTIGGTSEYIAYRTNFAGYPVKDILSSVSYFRESTSNTLRKYTLGTKNTKGKNIIPDQGNFLNSLSTRIPKVGLNSFLRNGWTYSVLAGASNPDSLSLVVESNTNTDDGKVLRIFGTAGNGSPPAATWVTAVFDNTNFIPSVNRYYQKEITLSTLPLSHFHYFYLNSDASGGKTYPRFDHSKTTNLTKVEYFYNAPEMIFEYDKYAGQNNITDYKFQNISVYEVDSIPFFQYTTQSGVDLSIRAQFVGVAPVIDYTNNNFDFIENVDLGIDYKTINLQNSVTANTTLKGTSVPIEYQIQASSESIESDFFTPGGGGDIQA